ncbi:MAG: hypothetical protein V4686_00725 [Patescibacteria group bacterium]
MNILYTLFFCFFFCVSPLCVASPPESFSQTSITDKWLDLTQGQLCETSLLIQYHTPSGLSSVSEQYTEFVPSYQGYRQNYAKYAYRLVLLAQSQFPRNNTLWPPSTRFFLSMKVLGVEKFGFRKENIGNLGFISESVIENAFPETLGNKLFLAGMTGLSIQTEDEIIPVSVTNNVGEIGIPILGKKLRYNVTFGNRTETYTQEGVRMFEPTISMTQETYTDYGYSWYWRYDPTIPQGFPYVRTYSLVQMTYPRGTEPSIFMSEDLESWRLIRWQPWTQGTGQIETWIEISPQQQRLFFRGSIK